MDFRNMHLHFTGPGPLDYMKHLPEGTSTFDMLQAPSGHVMLPCCKYPTPQEQTQPQDDGSLTLHATSSTTPPTETTPANVWNAFQHRYVGQGLTKDEWQPRRDLEKVHTETEVVQQFLALHRDDHILIPGGETAPTQQ